MARKPGQSLNEMLFLMGFAAAAGGLFPTGPINLPAHLARMTLAELQMAMNRLERVPARSIEAHNRGKARPTKHKRSNR